MAPENKVTGILRVGYAVHFPQAPRLGASYPLRGTIQTVQRAELRAVCCAIENAPSRLRIISDSSYVVSGITKMLSGNPHVSAKHQDLWKFVHTNIGLIHSVTWIRAHVQEAAQQGFQTEDWEGNRVVDFTTYLIQE